MWITLTRAAYAATLRAVAMDGRISDELTREIERPVAHGSNAKVDVFAPYAAWRFARDRLHGGTFGPRGGRQHATSRNFIALRTITRELNTIDTHPALRGIGAVGWQATIIPAWRIDPTDKDERMFSPYPIRGNEFVILTPVWEHVTGIPKVTRWIPRNEGVGRLADEEVHLRLWRA